MAHWELACQELEPQGSFQVMEECERNEMIPPIDQGKWKYDISWVVQSDASFKSQFS